jgi:hypothetical protein
METIYDKLNALRDEFITWCKSNNLPEDWSADDLLYATDAPPTTEAQKQWLIDFINRWDKADTK